MADDRLVVVSTHDAEMPLVHDGLRPLLTLNHWEHAYHLDYQNAGLEFVEVFQNNLVNWEFAVRNLEGAQSGQT